MYIVLIFLTMGITLTILFMIRHHKRIRSFMHLILSGYLIIIVTITLYGIKNERILLMKSKDLPNKMLSVNRKGSIQYDFVSSSINLSSEMFIDAPLISQLPELPRGCEVTSLAMLLNFAGVEVDKMTLARQIKKDTTPYIRKNGMVTFGNPNNGFVGNMYTFDQPGYGVYHGPIKDLAERYLPGQVIDLTGSDFETIKTYLNSGRPVWVIANTRFQKLSEGYFETWQTPSGKIKITYKEHSVLITGYDKDYIYFNDPLANKKRKVIISDFIDSWEQMGKQAITYKQALTLQ